MNAIQEMLVENTGRHFLDSGGAYGRNWERNQGRDFESEPAATLDVRYCGEGQDFRPDVTLNVYHWLRQNTADAPEMDSLYQAFADKRREDDYELSIMESFVKTLGARGLYGDSQPLTVNTYNGDCLLSQTLQFVYFETDDDAYVLLQVHGGCDVRGGYTDARVFRCDDSIFYFSNATIYADGPNAFNGDPYWITDDGWNWYHEGACGAGAGKGLHEYPVSFDPAHKGDGEHVYVDEDENTAYCPVTGHPLRVSPN